MAKAKKQPAPAPEVVVYPITLGCAKNLVDAEVMCGTMAVNGIMLTDDLECADLVLINTCGFIQSARDEAEQAIREAIRWKKAGRREGYERFIIVSGCLAQRSAPDCLKRFPEVDIYMGIDEVPNISKIILDLVSGEEFSAICVPEGAPRYLYDHNTPRILATPESYAYVEIAEGCNHRCSYCAIPGIRGDLRSRTPESVLAECKQLLEGGAKELNLIAQDTTAYGRDLPSKPTLASLLKEIDQLPGEFWVRVLYTHPMHITPEFIQVLGTGKHVVPYLDVPLQHIADNVLAGMRRGMNGKKTRELLEVIRRDYPQICIRTTFMTGFPGETPEGFEELRSLIEEFGFDRLGVFAFSPEAGTPAAEITAGIVPQKTAEQRRQKLLSLQKRISKKRNQARIGEICTMLVESEPDDTPYWIGRSTADAPEVDQTVAIKVKPNQKIDCGTFVKVRIIGASEYELTAELLP